MGEREKREHREKRQKGTELRIPKETSTLASACSSASGTEFPTRFCSKTLQQ